MTANDDRPPSTAAVPCSVWFGPVVSPAEERKLIDHLKSARGVGVCCWPRDAERVEHLAAADVPRLLLVGSEATAPAAADRQAWIVISATNDEVHDALVRLTASADGESVAASGDRVGESVRAVRAKRP
jgi:hypothetical protein